jgi:hypothetical protein
MGILASIMSSVLGSRPQPPPSQHSSMGGRPASGQAADPAAPQGTPRTPQPPSAAPGKTAPQVDVAAVLDKLAKESKERLDWRTSIVDLMKLLKLDSSLAARKTLAKELQYTGDTNDSAAMNVWLHKQVMAKLEQGGGRVPTDLRH